MDVDDDMIEIHQNVEYEIDAVTAQLNDIDELDDIDKLDLLIKELTIIDRYNVIPTMKWYKDHIRYIQMYSHLNWDYLINKFKDCDPFIYQTTIQIKATIATVLDNLISEQFSLDNYRFIIYNIRNVWTCNSKYGSDVEYNIDDLLIDMTYL
jgi:hypothetical protein